jgi:hypothetical protein
MESKRSEYATLFNSIAFNIFFPIFESLSNSSSALEIDNFPIKASLNPFFDINFSYQIGHLSAFPQKGTTLMVLTSVNLTQNVNAE